MKYLLLFFFIFVSATTFAEPPPNSDGQYKEWFHSLKDSNGRSCCSESDCRKVVYDINKEGHYVATVRKEDFVDPTSMAYEYYSGAWTEHHGNVDSFHLEIPDDKVIHQAENPTGHAVLCYSFISDRIYCFLPQSLT